MATHFKINEDDEHFLQVPADSSLIFAGLGDTETWIERAADCVVRLTVKSVAVATGPQGFIEVCLVVGADRAHGRDGPATEGAQLRASQSAQVLVKAGERLSFRAETHGENAHLLRTVVFAGDMAPDPARRSNGDARTREPPSHGPAAEAAPG